MKVSTTVRSDIQQSRCWTPNSGNELMCSHVCSDRRGVYTVCCLAFPHAISELTTINNSYDGEVRWAT